MSERSSIEWTDHTFNPWWGCTKVSPGCEHCYAERDSNRYGYGVWGATAGRRHFSDKHWSEPLRWDIGAKRLGIRRRVFCASMADVFEDREDLAAPRERLFDLIIATPNLDWQLLTKRPENFRRMLRPGWQLMPRLNVWFGVSVEDQATADARIPLLLKIPAAVRFVSYEPALDRVNFGGCEDLDWIIVGGESGPGARAFDVAWARETIDWCRAAGVACFVKQLGKYPSSRTAELGWDQLRETRGGKLSGDWAPPSGPTGKHGDPAEWPEDLRVREFPAREANP